VNTLGAQGNCRAGAIHSDLEKHLFAAEDDSAGPAAGSGILRRMPAQRHVAGWKSKDYNVQRCRSDDAIFRTSGSFRGDGAVPRDIERFLALLAESDSCNVKKNSIQHENMHAVDED